MEQKTLDDKVTMACHRIEELYNETGGKCYVSFSGGKDSTVLLALIKLCSDICTLPPEGIEAIFCNTGIEMGVTVDFVKWCKDNWYPNIKIIRPEKTFDAVLKERGKPLVSKIKSEFINRYHRNPTEATMNNLIYGKTRNGKRASRIVLPDKFMHMVHPDFDIKASKMCCDFLKKKPFEKYVKENNMKGGILGLRIEEGGARELNAMSRIKNGGKICTLVKKGIIQKYPIIDWSKKDVDDFIEKYNVPLSEAYTKYGFTRTGCMACPFALDVDKNLEYLFKYEPARYKAAMHWLKDVYIAQNVSLPFDEQYECDREQKWENDYERMRKEMLEKYRPNCRLLRRKNANKKSRPSREGNRQAYRRTRKEDC